MTKSYDLPTEATVTVSIGRNISTHCAPNANAGRPLRQAEWDQFIDRTKAIVLHACDSFSRIHFTGEGQGWFEGQAEESFTIIATIDADLLDELKARLSIIAHLFGQDSIAVTAGQTDIVAAVKSRR